MTTSINAPYSRRQTWAVYAGLLIFTLCLLLIVSDDAGFRISGRRDDSAWFLMCGRSWMEGLVPYRDFTDSKGPLLWLIYGFGTVISDKAFFGVFFFEIIFYWLTFCVLYRCALIMGCSRVQAVAASMTMALMFFYSGMHLQMRVEDFCHLFNALTLYAVLETLGKNRLKRSACFILGLSCGATLMIKYSYCATLLIPSAFIFFRCCRLGWSDILKFTGYWMAGFGAVVLPFIIYFLFLGNLYDFINEYFLVTSETIVLNNSVKDTVNESLLARWPFSLRNLLMRFGVVQTFFKILIIGMFWTGYRSLGRKSVLWCLWVWFLVSAILYSVVFSNRYFIMLAIFAFGGVVSLAKMCRNLSFAGVAVLGALTIAVAATLTAFEPNNNFYRADWNKASLKELGKVAYVINSWKDPSGRKPTLTYLYTWDRGEEIATKAVAGTKYWALQGGATPEMLKQHEEDVFIKHPDFVIVGVESPEIISKIEKEGYRKRLEYMPWPQYRGTDWTYYLYEYKEPR